MSVFFDAAISSGSSTSRKASISRFICRGFEPETLRGIAGRAAGVRSCWISGADIGSHTLPLAQMEGPSGRVCSFEPTDCAFGKQGRNLSLNPEFSRRVNALQAMLVGRSTQEMPEAIPSSWPLDNESGTELDTIHVGRFNTLEGAQRKTR
jgi:hypothetical protein